MIEPAVLFSGSAERFLTPKTSSNHHFTAIGAGYFFVGVGPLKNKKRPRLLGGSGDV